MSVNQSRVKAVPFICWREACYIVALPLVQGE